MISQGGQGDTRWGAVINSTVVEGAQVSIDIFSFLVFAILRDILDAVNGFLCTLDVLIDFLLREEIVPFVLLEVLFGHFAALFSKNFIRFI